MKTTRSCVATIALAVSCGLSACALNVQKSDIQVLQKQVADTERAFAKTMADRDHPAFAALLADETVFLSGPVPLHGKQRVADFWKRFFEKPEAPFSWEPEIVEVLDSGTLALSTGPVRDPTGKLFATYTSIWRLEAPGIWRIIFDRGNDVCDCPKP